MKKMLFFVSILIIGTSVHSQITFNQSNMPTAGMQFTFANDSLYSGSNLSTTGANQTWNFSSLVNHFKSYELWMTPSSAPGASNFPTSNLAMKTFSDLVSSGGGVIEDDTTFSFGNVSSTAYELLGSYGVNIGTIKFSQPYKIFQFPLTYQTSFNSGYTTEMKEAVDMPPMDSMKMNISMNTTNLVDGWGTITTPSFTNIPCLRLKTTFNKTISVYLHNSITNTWEAMEIPSNETYYTYNWLSNTHKTSLLRIDQDGANEYSAEYLLNTETSFVDENNNNINISLYPTPADNEINVSGVDENCNILIFDINGRNIANRSLTAKISNKIDVSNLSNGTYIYRIISDEGKNFIDGRFVIER